MSTWINVDVYPARRRRLVILMQRTYMNLSVFKEQDPEKIFEAFKQILVALRPELEGCQIEAVQYDPARARWVTSVEHHSFDPVEEGAMPPEIAL